MRIRQINCTYLLGCLYHTCNVQFTNDSLQVLKLFNWMMPIKTINQIVKRFPCRPICVTFVMLFVCLFVNAAFVSVFVSVTFLCLFAMSCSSVMSRPGTLFLSWTFFYRFLISAKKSYHNNTNINLRKFTGGNMFHRLTYSRIT